MNKRNLANPPKGTPPVDSLQHSPQVPRVAAQLSPLGSTIDAWRDCVNGYGRQHQ